MHSICSHFFSLFPHLALAGPLSPSLTIPITPLEIEQPKQQELGYMPYRDDFERVSDKDKK